MGIDLNKIPNSYLGEASLVSTTLKDQQILINIILEDLKKMPWQDVNFQINGTSPEGRTFYILLPDNIIKFIKDFREIFPNEHDSLGQWVQLNDRSPIYMETNNDANFRRSHFPNGGIPDALKGIGLGYKFYRKLIEVCGYLRSDTMGASIKNHVWASLVKKKEDPDDVHAIVGPRSVFAMIKTLPQDVKIELATRYLASSNIDVNSIDKNNFAVDDELKEILPKSLIKNLFNPEYQARMRQIREENQRNERVEEITTLTDRNRSLFPIFGINEINTDWEIGDIIVRFTYLHDNTAKLRVVINHNGIKAISIGDYIKYALTGELANNIAIRTPDHIEWTKVDLSSIDNFDEARLTQSEQSLVRTLIEKGLNNIPDNFIKRITQLSQAELKYGPILKSHDKMEFKQLVENRMVSPETFRKFSQGNFANKILLSPTQNNRFNSKLTTEVFIPFNGAPNNMKSVPGHSLGDCAINSLTGYVFENPQYDDFTIKTIAQINSIDSIEIGDMVYIANHPVYAGLVVKVALLLKNDVDIEYAMVNILNPELGKEAIRKTSIQLNLLRKIY